MVPDAGDRSAIVHGVDVFHIFFLSRVTERAVSAALAEDISLSPVPHGAGYRPHRNEHTGGDGSVVRSEVLFQADAKVSRTSQGREIDRSPQVSQALRFRP